MPGWGMGRTLPPIQNSIRGTGDAAADPPQSSPDRYRIPLRIVGKAAKRAFPAIPEDQLDRIRQARSGLLFRAALTVGSRYFRTVYDIPVSVSLEDCRGGIVHRSTARRNFLSIRCDGQQRCESRGHRISRQIRKAAGSRRSALREAAPPRAWHRHAERRGGIAPGSNASSGRPGRCSARLSRRPCGSGVDRAARARRPAS